MRVIPTIHLRAGDVIDAPDCVVVEYWAPPPAETVWIDQGDI